LVEAITEEHSDDVVDTKGFCQNAQVDTPCVNLSEFSLNERESHDWDGSDDEVNDLSDETSDPDLDFL
jgi:hypothetical protein